MIRVLLVFLFSGAAGWALSRLQEPRGAVAPAVAGGEAREEGRKQARTLRTPEDFAQWAQERAGTLKRRGLGLEFEPNDAKLAEWSADELKRALEQGLRDPACVRYGPQVKAMHSLLEEWTRRDADAAWEWFTAVPAEHMRWRLCSGIVLGWPRERAEEGVELVIAHRDHFEGGGGYGYSPLVSRAMEVAAERGPEAVEALLLRLRDQDMQFSVEALKFPARFDFAAAVRRPLLAKSLESDGARNYLVDAWMSQSPEAAFEGLLTLNREKGWDLPKNLFSGFLRYTETDPPLMAERARKLGLFAGTLPEEEQRQILQAGVEKLSGSPELLREFAAALPDPALRREANLEAAAGLVAKDLPEALAFLEAGSDPAERLEYLETFLADRPAGSSGYLNGESEEAVRKTLAAWGSDAARIDELVATMKNIRR